MREMTFQLIHIKPNVPVFTKEVLMRLIVQVTFLFFFSITAAWSHPPSKMQFSYNPLDRILSITVIHPTADTMKHYIDEITVEYNNAKRVVQTFISQLNGNEQKAVYLLFDVKPGDSVEVTGKCNMYGKKKEKYQIPGA